MYTWGSRPKGTTSWQEIPGSETQKPHMMGTKESFLGTQDGSVEEHPFSPGAEKWVLFAHKTWRANSRSKLMNEAKHEPYF